jgi:hypothetical protein
MRLNLAVYTAQEGYSWQNGTKITNSDLIEYKRMIGRFPDPTVDIIPFGGAFLCNDKAVFYRFHIAKQADSKGRDALYLILGVCDKKYAKDIDVKTLFEQNEFACVNSKFPTELNYIGGTSAIENIDFSVSFNKNYSRKEDMSILGALLTNCPNNNLSIKINGSDKLPTIIVTYKATPIKADTNFDNSFTPRITNNNGDFNKTKKLSSTYIPIDDNTNNNNNSMLNIIVVVIAISFFIIGILVGYFLRGFLAEDKGVTESTPVVKETIKVKDNFNNNRTQKPVVIEIKTPKAPENMEIINNNRDNGKEDTWLDKIPELENVRDPKVPEQVTPQKPQTPFEVNKPKSNDCPDCGEAIVGCQECRRTGSYRGKICNFCNGKGEKEVIYYCPKHRKPKLRNEAINSHPESLKQDKMMDNSRDNVVSSEIKINSSDKIEPQSDKTTDVLKDITKNSGENINE